MILFLIGILILAGVFNIMFYEYRVFKKPNDFDVFENWVQFKLKQKYK